MPIVYMASNKVSGKRYVGATKYTIEYRSDRHFKDAKRKGRPRDCPRFYEAIRKYGRDAFEWTTLAVLSTSEEMYKEEERLIALLNPEYNIASGGLIFTSKEKQLKFAIAGAQRSSKQVICLNDGLVYPSAAEAARFYGVERHNLGNLCRRGGVMRNGLSFAFLTKPMSDADRESMLNERKLRKISAESARIDLVIGLNSRTVTDLKTGKIYPSARAAEHEIGISGSTVSYLCRTGNINQEGFCFSFGELTEEERLLKLKIAEDKNQQTKKEWKKNLSKARWLASHVRCDTYGITFRSAESASLEYCISAASIREVCNGRRDDTFGLKFSYIENRT